MGYEAVIGLEIHSELKTKTKMFCFCLNDPDEKHPNLNTCPVCMGHPGTLPVINEEAVKKVIKVGLALNGTIPEFSQFDRKNYFYPDLPKGYQISQYKHPLVQGGYLELQIPNPKSQILNKLQAPNPKLQTRRIRITRVHLEEDTGKLMHDKDGGASLVDFNRAGVPLMELVTEPDIRESREIIQFGEELQRILRYLGASDANMEKGQMRVEVNISLTTKEGLRRFEESSGRPDSHGESGLGTKVEIKNINSFKFSAEAAEFEIKRQAALLDSGEKIIQETRGWNDHKGETFSQRSKEEAHDYRYFPEPDLPPLRFDKEYIETLRAGIPELPAQKRERFSKEYGLEPDIAGILARDKTLADYYEKVVSELKQHDKEIPRSPEATGIPAEGLGTADKPKMNLEKTASAILTGEFLSLLNETSVPANDTRITPENMAELILYLAEDKISNLVAKRVLEEMFRSGEDPSDIIEKLGLWQMSDSADLNDIVRHSIKENPKAVESYKKGKEASLQFLVGQVMKETRGKANPKIVQGILKKIINE